MDALIAEASGITEGVGKPRRLIVVDTLNRAMAGGNENSSDDMGKLVEICQAIARHLRCFVLVIHHSGKDVARGMRGHSSLLGAVDTELQVGDRVIKVTKQRDGEDGIEFGFELEPVTLGQDEDGDPVTTCVVIPASAREKRRMARKQKGPTGRTQKVVLPALRQFVDDHGARNPGGTGWPERGAVRIVKVTDFVDFAKGKITSGDNDTTRRKRAREAIDGLASSGFVALNDGHIWVT